MVESQPYVFIQARMGSSRLPSKVLKHLYKEQSILQIILNALSVYFDAEHIYLCTSSSKEDDVLEDWAQARDLHIYRGSENDVLSRFTELGNRIGADHIVRICADNPILHIPFVLDLIEKAKENPESDYISYRTNAGVPSIKTHYGFFAEIVRLKALNKVNRMTQDPLYREHVTNYIYTNSTFDCKYIAVPDYFEERSYLRTTVDNLLDFKNAQEIYKKYVEFHRDLEKLVHWVDSQESLKEVMEKNIREYTK